MRRPGEGGAGLPPTRPGEVGAGLPPTRLGEGGAGLPPVSGVLNQFSFRIYICLKKQISLP